VPALPPSDKRSFEGDTAAHRRPIPTSTTFGITLPQVAAASTLRSLIDSITDRFFLLASYPNIGRASDEDLRPDLRSFPVGEYVIIYRIQDGDALILRVLRGSRNIAALFGH